MLKNKYILQITPQTNVRATQGDRIFFRIPREKLRKAGLSRLMRLEKYNEYKIDLSAKAEEITCNSLANGLSHILYQNQNLLEFLYKSLKR